jgi:AraC-like DNA-binding protein
LADRPAIFARGPERSDAVDAFSEVLSTVKLQGAVFFNAEFSAPWGFLSPRSDFLAPHLLPGAERLVIYHLVLEGSASVRPQNGEAVSLGPGDIVVFPHGDPHHMACGSPLEFMDTDAVLKLILRRNLTPMCAGGGGAVTRFVCGYMACDSRLSQPILGSLPAVIKVNIREDASGQWLEKAIRHLVEEAASSSPGSSAMLAKLSEALFVDTLRRYIAQLPEEQTGWLAGTRDPHVGKSLAILHRRPEHPWTIAELAREVGLSRSTLVERFSRYLSEPPMAYLTRWRLQLAARALDSTSDSMAQIAAEVGYVSEAAFNRAFKREFGLPPARFRRERKADPGKVRPTATALAMVD